MSGLRRHCCHYGLNPRRGELKYYRHLEMARLYSGKSFLAQNRRQELDALKIR